MYGGGGKLVYVIYLIYSILRAITKGRMGRQNQVGATPNETIKIMVVKIMRMVMTKRTKDVR